MTNSVKGADWQWVALDADVLREASQDGRLVLWRPVSNIGGDGEKRG